MHRSLAGLGFNHEPRDTRELGVGAHARRAHGDHAIDVDSGAHDGITHAHLDRQGLPREQRGVDGAGTVLDDPISGDALARAHHESFAHMHVRDRDPSFDPVDDEGGVRSREFGECPQGGRRASLGAGLEPPAGEQEDRHGGSDLEVDVRQPHLGVTAESVRHRVADLARSAEDNRPQAPQVRRKDTHAHERVHRRGSMTCVDRCRVMEGPGTPSNDDGCQGESNPLPAGELQCRDHGERDDRQGQHQRDDEAGAQGINVAAVAHAIAHRGSRVARLLHHAHEVGHGDVGVEFDVGALGRVVDRGMHSRHAIELALDA